jgi:galactokinase
MSSSSALMIGVATALVRVAGIEARAEWRMNIRGTLDAAGYYACIENGFTFGTLEGDAGVGTQGGSEDHAAILAATPGHVSAFAFVPMRHAGSVAVPEHWRFVLAPCGVTAEKTGTAREAYNRLAHAARALLDLWNAGGRRPQAVSLASVLQNPRAAHRLRDLARSSAPAGWPKDALEERLDHFTREDARVPEALDAFREADAAKLTAFSEQSQADAETLLGNQIPETIALARSARALGAFAACSFGAGFGGSVWALADRAAADELAQHWHPGAFVAAPGPSLTEL